MKRRINIVCVFLLFSPITGCVLGGTHGGIKSYEYPLKKDSVKEAIFKVIRSNQHIILDSDSDYYNDADRYISFKVKTPDIYNDYTLHFRGNEQYWDTATTTIITLVYAFGKDGRGGSRGDGGVSWYTPFLKNRLIRCFENELVERVDSILQIDRVTQ
ncbi:MAG: hypothetical protein JNM41_10525 [Flavipsychrobacter sp.]|nr:hypothetical protein [Flavipsychrobacter sp.]